MKKIILVLVTIMLVLSLTGCNVKPEQKDDIYIFFTSDVHCGVDENLSLAGFKAIINETKKEHEYVRLVDLGDNLQGGTLGSLSQGKLIIELMNDMGYDYATVGNHEFDYGLDVLAQRMSEANFKYLAANVQYTGTKENIFKDTAEYVIDDFDGIKIAFIGVLTPQTRTTSTPKFFMENDEFVYDFYSKDNGQQLYDRVQSIVDEVRKKGADKVVILGHLGSTYEENPYDSISLIAHTSGIDVVLDGHSHSIIIEDRYPNKNGEDVILSSVGTQMQAGGLLILGKDGTISTMHFDENATKDPDMEASIRKAYDQINSVLREKVCDLDYDMMIADEDNIRMVRSREVTPANFVADAFRYAYGTDIALTNGGGVRSSLKAGEITYNDLLKMTPFQNSMAVVRATGQQILDALEFGARLTNQIYKFDDRAVGENGAFLQVSGLKYTIDGSAVSPVILDENDMMTGIDNIPRKVKDVMVLQNGEYVPIDPQATYTVASINYILFNSGDGNTAFQGAEAIVENGMTDVETLKLYLEHLGGFGDLYREVEGRIVIE